MRHRTPVLEAVLATRSFVDDIAPPLIALTLTIASLLLAAGCERADPSDSPAGAVVVARYRDWRAPGAEGEVTLEQLRAWRTLTRKPASRQAPLDDQLAELLRTERLAEAAPQPLPDEWTRRVREAEERVLEQALRTAVRTEARARAATADPTATASTRRPRLLRLRSLLVRVAPDASDAERRDARARAESIREDLSTGADFGEMAGRFSDSETRSRSGRLGWVDPQRLAPELREAALALSPGEHSGVLASPDGWVLLSCEGIRPAETVGAARSAAAARSRDERLAWAELRADLLAESAADPALADASPQARMRGAAARRARARGLDEEPGTATRLHWARARVIASAMLRQQALARAEDVDPDAVRAHYDAQPERWQTLPTRKIKAIRLARDRDSAEGDLAQRKKATDLRAALDAGSRLFAFAARDVSDHPSRPRGGELGALAAREVAALGPDVARAIEALEPGEISPVVAQDDGFWIVRLVSRDPGRKIPLEEVAETLEYRLREARIQDAAAAITQELRAELELEVVSGVSADSR